MEGIRAAHSLGAALLDNLADPVGAVGADMGDLVAAFLTQSVEEAAQRRPVPTHACPHQPTTVVVDHDNAYLGAMSAGVLILDIRDPANIQLQSKFRPDPDFPRPNPNSLQRPNARGLALVGNRLFVAYDAGGVRILDVANRQQPQEIGRYINLGMGQKQQAYNNLIVDGDRLYAAIDYAGLEILDIKRVDAIRQVGWWNPWKAHTLQNLWFNSPGHTNQLEFDRKQQRIYLSAGDSELQVVDVAKPDHPQLVAQHGQSQNGLGTWGVALDENAAYLTYMTAIVPFRGTWAGVAAIKRN